MGGAARNHRSKRVIGKAVLWSGTHHRCWICLPGTTLALLDSLDELGLIMAEIVETRISIVRRRECTMDDQGAT